MRTKLVSEVITYTGEQLHSHWIYQNFGIPGDAIIAFRGPIKIPLKDNTHQGFMIGSEDMLHFIVEHFDSDIEKAIYRQRLLISIISDELNNKLRETSVYRIGNDLYENENRLLSSIITLSPVSTIIYAGINVLSRGTEAKLSGLQDYNIEPNLFASIIMDKYKSEIEGIREARYKVTYVE